MEHKLPELPWAQDALEPHISAETISYHYVMFSFYMTRFFINKLNCTFYN